MTATATDQDGGLQIDIRFDDNVAGSDGGLNVTRDGMVMPVRAFRAHQLPPNQFALLCAGAAIAGVFLRERTEPRTPWAFMSTPALDKALAFAGYA
ncbi:hypothetical protein ACWDUL_20775 [Nocardia niigatensis]